MVKIILTYSSRDKHLTKPNPKCGGGIGLFIKTGLEYEILDFPNHQYRFRNGTTLINLEYILLTLYLKPLKITNWRYPFS